ncbi:hypothetical protein, partial [Escherichia coli]|uniref:hypothetical protein n=1 Tax=Escherichia coli TaxID=562 RepID=UPI001BCB3C8E
IYLPRIGQVENMSVEGLFVHGGDLWRLNTPLSCLQPPQQGKTHINTVTDLLSLQSISHGVGNERTSSTF